MSTSTTHFQQRTPSCIGIIMDGNRRWAKEQGLATIEGHKAGYEKFKEVAEWCKEAGLKHLAVYAFSTENWNRNKEEVSYLLDLMRELLEKGLPEMHKQDVAVHIVGDLSRFPDDIQTSIDTLHGRNPVDPAHHLWVCASYGGKPELLAAVNTLLARGVQGVSEKEVSDVLWTAGMPDPDIIIRTGGQRRLSNFLLWHAGYAELFFIDTYWPAFSKREFTQILHDYGARTRNYGT